MARYVMLWALVIPGAFREPLQSEDPRPTEQQECQDWTTRKELPLLRAEPLEPIEEHDQFDGKPGALVYRRENMNENRAEGFGDDGEAIQVAEAFLKGHFGRLQNSVFPTGIAKGKDVSSDVNGPDLAVGFEARYHGIPLDGYGAVIYFRGKIIAMASIMLVSVSPVPESERGIISREQALRTWNDQAPEALKKAIQPKNLRLIYVWSPRDNMDPNVDRNHGDILRPNWEIHDGLLIDAFDGKIWRDD